MAGTFTVKILQDGLNKAQEQAKATDNANKQLQKNLKKTNDDISKEQRKQDAHNQKLRWNYIKKNSKEIEAQNRKNIAEYNKSLQASLSEKSSKEKKTLSEIALLNKRNAIAYVNNWKTALAEREAKEKKILAETAIINKRNAAEYIGFWKTALATREANEKKIINTEKQNLAIRKNTFKQIHADELAYAKKTIAINKQVLATKSKDDRKYWNLKAELARQNIGLTKGLSQEELASLKKSSDKAVEYERIAYNKKKEIRKKSAETSVDLAQKLQDNLKSIFQRAVFYTAVYRGIQLVNQAFRDWISTNVELDYALAKVNTISEVTISQMHRLTNLSIDTGRGLTDVTNALYEINSAGITGARAMQVLEVSTKAAVGGFVDAKNAADTLTDVLNAYKLSTSQTELVSDKLLKTVELGKLKWENYQGVLGRVLPQAYNLGIGLDELLGSLGTLTLSGLKFREAAVGMRNIMIKLQKPTKGMDKALIGLNRNLGETYGSIQDVIKAKGLIPTIQLLGDVLDSTDLETVDLFNNVRGLTAQLSLMSDAGAKATEITAKIADSAGTTKEKMAIMSETIQESQNRLSSAWQALGVDLFNFNKSLIGIVDIVSKLVLKLRDFAPIIIGIGSAIGVLAIGAGLLGVKFLIVSQIVPLVGGLFASFVPIVNATSLANLELGASLNYVSASMWSFNSALTVITVVVAAFALTYAGMTAWFKKGNDEAKRVWENTNNMTKAFREAKVAANLLSKASPFEGMTNTQITEQIAQNNKLLKDRVKILDKIAYLESKSGDTYYYEKGFGLITVNEALKIQENSLFIIEGYQGRNLIAMKALNREQDYRNRKLSREQAVIEEITKGYADSLFTLESAKALDLPQIKKITAEIEKQLKLEKKRAERLSGFTGSDIAYKIQSEKLLKLLGIFNDAKTEKENAFKKHEIENDKKHNKKKIDFIKKFREAALNETIQGRLKLIEEERNLAIKTANDNAKLLKNIERDLAIDKIQIDRKKAIKKANENKKATALEIEQINKLYDEKIESEKKKVKASESDLALINKFFNNKKLKEQKDHYSKMAAEAKVLNDKTIKERERLLNIEIKIAKLKQESDKETLNWWNKTQQEQSDLKDKYISTDTEKIIAKYKKDLDLAIKGSDLYKAIIKAREKEITEIKIAEWNKQHEYQAMLIQSSVNAFEASVNSIIDFAVLQSGALIKSAKVTSATLNNIWVSWKNAMLNIIATVMFKMAALWLLQKAVFGNFSLGGEGFLGGLFRGLSGAFGGDVKDAIIQDGVITSFDKGDVVAIGTNLYGSRSGAGGNTSGVEKKLDMVIQAIDNGTIANMKKEIIIPQQVIDPARLNDLNEQGKKINRRID